MALNLGEIPRITWKTTMTRHLNDNTPQATTVKKVKRVANAILVSCGLFLLLVMVLVTLPKLESTQYVMGICNVTGTKLNKEPGKQLQCHCAEQNSDTKCTIFYPCLQVYVSYNNVSVREALVVKDRRRISEECSYKLRDYACQTKDDVYKHVETFREKWGVIHSSYKCFHASRHPNRVTLSNKAPSTALAVNLTLFPCIGVVIGLVMLHYKEQIGLIVLRRLRIGVHEGYLPLTLVRNAEDSRERERTE